MSGSKKEVTKRTVTEKDGVKEVHETVEYKNESIGGQKEEISSGSNSMKPQKMEEKHEESTQKSQKGGDKTGKAKDIGQKDPYPTKEKLKKEQKESKVSEEKDPVDEFVKRLPEYDSEAAANFESHKENLTPCSHCERTFTPDRLAKHEKVCTEKRK